MFRNIFKIFGIDRSNKPQTNKQNDNELKNTSDTENNKAMTQRQQSDTITIKNLYVTLDSKRMDKLKSKIESSVFRYPKFKHYCKDRDAVEALLSLLFPDNMPIIGYISNRQYKTKSKYSQIGFRINPHGLPDWPFPSELTFIATGSYPTESLSSVFLISDFIETSHQPARD
ncbi:MAG: hypothetical protein H7707_06595, partial [Acetobacter sp.]|nr:hypothetical protein [Acetobacter sp.]